MRPTPVNNFSAECRDAPLATDRVLLFGEVLLDDFGVQRMVGGAPFNVARHLQAFGLSPLLISRIGDDTDGRALAAVLGEFGVDVRGVQIDARHPTGSVRVRTQAQGHAFEIPPDQAYDHIDAQAAMSANAGNAPPLFYFGTLAQRGPVSSAALQALLETVNAPRMVDLNLRPPWYDAHVLHAALASADILKLNRDEFDVLSWLFKLPGKRRHQRANSLMSKFAIGKLLLTEGAEGVWLLNADGRQAATLGAPDATITSTVGAGDACAAVFILGFLRGWDDALTVARADAFARAVCRIRGAVPMGDGFYMPFLKQWQIA